jgi:hypothetical protein
MTATMNSIPNIIDIVTRAWIRQEVVEIDGMQIIPMKRHKSTPSTWKDYKDFEL